MSIARKGWDVDLRDGIANEERVEKCLRYGKIEVKRDEKAASTGNVFIEIYCSGKSSGLRATEADTWCITIPYENGQTDFLIPTNILRTMARYFAVTKGVVSGGDDGKTVGILIPVDAFVDPRKYNKFDYSNFSIKNATAEDMQVIITQRLEDFEGD